ncbi:DUF2953 domain-containing protein [Terrisporobacter sp.]|uniref:DUF2953 domain-containing protein n=1 Tax=Terrisporobacter sp. TaxID=1965305 RepID=UPI00262A7EE8|nr:DUF2953 domain-containing protein [Terrisporobacter sp.]
MKYINLHPMITIFLAILILLIISYNHFILTIYIKDNKVKVLLNIKMLFKLIRIKKQIYPGKKKKKNKKIGIKNIKFLRGELQNIIDLCKKIKIVEVYSNLKISNKNTYITIYLSALINGIYGNIINIFDYEKIYLNLVQSFTDDYFDGTIRIHIKLRMNNIVKAILLIFKIMKKGKTKEGE